LKINKIFTKGLRKKIQNQNNRDQIEKNKIWLVGIEGSNWKKNLYKKTKKIEIKRIRTKT
jgi:hypothetical protein